MAPVPVKIQEILDDISWEGATESASNPLEATVSKGTASKNVVRIKYQGNTIRELRVWVVWSTITSSSIAISTSTAQSGNPSGPAVGVEGGYNFTHTIQPATIITDANRPNFSGTNTTAPPGTSHPITGDPLSGGANKKWDNSRQIKAKFINPNNILLQDTGSYALSSWPSDISSYPSESTEGTDDTSAGEETNDPYANGGKLTGVDKPSQFVCDRAGSNGNTLERRLHFREFTRLEIEGTWYRISDYYLWRIHLKQKRVTGFWANDGTSKALNNTGF